MEMPNTGSIDSAGKVMKNVKSGREPLPAQPMTKKDNIDSVMNDMTGVKSPSQYLESEEV